MSREEKGVLNQQIEEVCEARESGISPETTNEGQRSSTTHTANAMEDNHLAQAGLENRNFEATDMPGFFIPVIRENAEHKR